MKVTDRQITMRVARLQNEGMNIGLDGQYGRFRVTDRDGSCDLSPRGSNREIMDWLEAYELGFDHGKEAASAVTSK